MKKPTLKTWRRFFQFFVAFAFILIPIINRSRYSYVYGNFLSFHMFGLPLSDPLAVLQLSVKNLYWPTFDNFAGAFLPLLLAFTLGTVFCSWVCPYGLFSELTQKLSRRILGKKYRGLRVAQKGFPLKMTLFLVGFAAFLVFSTTPVLNQLSMPAWYTRFFQYLFGQDVISLCFLFILAVLLLEFFAAKRLWCRYICPQSILITLVKQLNPGRLHVAFDPEKCICKPGYERCEMVCTLHLLPKTLTEGAELECSNCGDCLVACKKMGQALEFSNPGFAFLSHRTSGLNLPSRRKIFLSLLGAVVLAGLGLAVSKIHFQFSTRPHEPIRAASDLLDNKIISWQGARADYYELLGNGTLICVGGNWPLNGYKGGRWQQVDGQRSFTLTFDPAYPATYTRVSTTDSLATGSVVQLSQYEKNELIKKSRHEAVVTKYASITKSHRQSAIDHNATVVLSRYAQQVYVLDLRVQDPKGEIRKILTQGDAITNEVMLTNVKYWLNTPEIIVSEGAAPDLPIRSTMEILFFDDHKEVAEFSTVKIVDRSAEEFDDPWF